MTIAELAASIEELRETVLRSHPPEIMTPKECAAYLEVTDETLFRWRKDGFGPPYSQPNSRIVRYLRSEVVEWLKEVRA